MTITSLKLLAHFLNTHPQSGRIADYGGTEHIGAEIVRTMLSLKNMEVSAKGKPGEDTHITANGEPRKEKVEYVVLDYDNGVDLLKPIKGKKFDGGVCMDLLEHVTNPFIVAENISNSLKKDALLFVTAPWVWEVHNYPGDYWRYTEQGMITLFPKMKVIAIETIRDASPDEDLPRGRIVAVFKKK